VHPVHPAGKKGVPLIGIDLEDPRDDDHARLLILLACYRSTVSLQRLRTQRLHDELPCQHRVRPGALSILTCGMSHQSRFG
jgi:hypothetical protein